MNKYKKHQVPLRLQPGINELLVQVAEKIGISKNALITEILWQWKKRLKRAELLKMFDEERLTELEIKIYGEVKNDAKRVTIAGG